MPTLATDRLQTTHHHFRAFCSAGTWNYCLKQSPGLPTLRYWHQSPQTLLMLASPINVPLVDSWYRMHYQRLLFVCIQVSICVTLVFFFPFFRYAIKILLRWTKLNIKPMISHNTSRWSTLCKALLWTWSQVTLTTKREWRNVTSSKEYISHWSKLSFSRQHIPH